MSKKKMTGEEKAKRDKEIVEALKSGEEVLKVAKKFKLSEIWVGRIGKGVKAKKAVKSGKVEKREAPKTESNGKKNGVSPKREKEITSAPATSTGEPVL